MNNEQSFLTLDLLLVTNLVLENFDIAIITLNALILHYTSISQSRFFGQNLVVKKLHSKSHLVFLHHVHISHFDINYFITNTYICFVPTDINRIFAWIKSYQQNETLHVVNMKRWKTLLNSIILCYFCHQNQVYLL